MFRHTTAPEWCLVLIVGWIIYQRMRDRVSNITVDLTFILCVTGNLVIHFHWTLVFWLVWFLVALRKDLKRSLVG